MDIVKAAIVLVLVAALLLFARNALAGEWFDEAAIYVDVTADSSEIYCGSRGDLASHIGARVDLYSEGPHTVRAMWVHNSCVEAEDDLRNRDALGIGYEFQLW